MRPLRFCFWLCTSLTIGCSSVGDDQTNEQSDAQVRFPAIERERALNDLTPDEVHDLCSWGHTVAPGGSKKCDDGSLIVKPGLAEHLCADTLKTLDPSCSARVDDFARCAESNPCDALDQEEACAVYDACKGARADL